ncbi:unnamed protein product [Fusarium equiseti]|uniref:Small secreted protein n=1 Tax=Fusarium equiseti TaxID=61235 RepID=A0A8J2IJW8_FUSEQ|nr:unnamed protein product [Fusarium equiseti]
MKFSILAQAIPAIPALASAIPEPVDTTNRESTALITEPRNDDHLKVYCDILAKNTVQLENQQCYWRDGMYVVDISEVQGPAGHSQYKHQHNIAADRFQKGTGCDVIRNT